MSMLATAAQVAQAAPAAPSGGGIDPLIVAFVIGAILALVFLGVVLRGNEDFDDLRGPDGE